MKICYVYCDIPKYVRNKIILRSLEQSNINIIKCNSNSKYSLVRHIKKLATFFLSRKQDYDLVFVGFVGQPLVPIIRRLTNKPILFDAFMSVYDTVCFDKKKASPNSLFGKLCYALDKCSCNATDKILLDTYQHINYFTKEFGIAKEKFERIWAGSDDSVYYPRTIKKEDEKFIVGFHGRFIPLQGVQYIIKAAKILENNPDIKFRIIGKGQTFEENVKLSKKLRLNNIVFEGMKKYTELPNAIATADVCLGMFGDTAKTQRVMSHKLYDALAMRKPLITAETPAAKELLQNRKNVLYCKAANPNSLAEAILELKDNPKLRCKIANNGYETFKKNCTPKIIGKRIKKIAEKLIRQ